MKKKEKTLERKMERKLKEFEKKGIFDINTLKLEIHAHNSFGYQNEIFDGIKNDNQFNIEGQYHNELTQDSIWGTIF